jgi:hypothetical protein
MVGGLAYMFNFYVAYFLLNELWPTWPLYTLLPFALSIFLTGMSNAAKGLDTQKEVLLIAVLVQILAMSLFFPPFLIWSGLLIAFFGFQRYKGQTGGQSKVVKSRILKFVAKTALILVATGAWWEYGEVQAVFGYIGTFSQPGTSYNLAINIELSRFLNPSGNGFRSFLNVAANYPIPYPPVGANIYSWQSLYSATNSLFVFLGVGYIVLLFLPALKGRPSKSILFPNVWLYTLFIILVGLGIKGDDPIVSAVVNMLYDHHFPYLNLTYGLRQEFIGFPITFLSSILIAKASIVLFESSINSRKNFPSGVRSATFQRRNFGSLVYKTYRTRRVALPGFAVTLCALLLVVSIVVYPWYLLTPYATQVFPMQDGQVIPSVVSFPNYFYSASDYLAANAGSADTLILPEMYDFYSMQFGNSGFADDAPAGLIYGSPVVYHIDPDNSVYEYIQEAITESQGNSSKFAILLADFNVKYVLLNTVFAGDLQSPSYNISQLTQFLAMQSGLSFVRSFGPLLLYENLVYGGIMQTGVPVSFSGTPVYPPGSISILGGNNLPSNTTSHSVSFYNPYPNETMLSENSSTLNYSYPSYQVGKNPLLVYTASGLSWLNPAIYRYLTVTFETAPFGRALFYIQLNLSYRIGNFTSYLNPHLLAIGSGAKTGIVTPPTDPYYYSSSPDVLVFSTVGGVGSNFNIPLNVTNITLNRIYLGLYVLNGEPKQADTVSISGFVFSKRLPVYGGSDFLTNYMNGTLQVMIPDASNYSHFAQGSYSVNCVEDSPTHYVAHVYSSGGPFVLMLKQDYNPSWHASFAGGDEIPPSQHVLADDYANGWIINRSGNFTVDVSYGPQTTYNLVVGFSIVANGITFATYVVRRKFTSAKVK